MNLETEKTHLTEHRDGILSLFCLKPLSLYENTAVCLEELAVEIPQSQLYKAQKRSLRIQDSNLVLSQKKKRERERESAIKKLWFLRKRNQICQVYIRKVTE